MIKKLHSTGQKGYTLIELLLYITILGSLLTGLSLYFVTSTTARVKNQTVAEVDRQGALVMDYITQTIRNASSITSPAAGTSGDTLTLTVPNASLSPTVFNLSGGGGSTILGYNQDGFIDDSLNGGTIRTTKFVAGASGTVTSLYAHTGPIINLSNNKGQMAIYSGTSNPTTLLASSSSVVLAPASWNTFNISPVTITAGQTYWLAYNTNATSPFDNNLRFHAGASGQSMTHAQAFGSWPAPFTGTSQDWEFSMYAEIEGAGGGGGDETVALQVKEGAGSEVPLVNEKVQISSLTFTNLTRPGTPGVVRVSFTIARNNPNDRNEYQYQKTFTGTAALRP